MRLGIRAQLIGFTLATALVVGGITIGYSIHKQRIAIRQSLQTRARTMASSLANALVDPFYEADINRLSLQLELAQRDQDVLAARAHDESGIEIASGAVEGEQSATEPELDLQQLRTSNWEALRPGMAPDSFTAVSPVRIGGGEPIGFVCLTFTETLALEQIRHGTWEQVGLLSVLFILGTVLAITLSRRFVNPIHAMVAGTTAIRNGRFDTRIAVTGPDELGQLAQSINAMAETLENTTVSKERLELANCEIHAQVEELEAQQQELLEVNSQLESAKVDALLATKTKSDFLANMSHEIRTPITAILGYSENLHQGDLSESEASDAVETIYKNGQYLLSLINDILDMSKIEAGKMTMECILVSPNQVIADVVSLMQVRCDAKNLTLDIEYVGSIPETIQSDPTRLKQILINILGNAVKFTQTGGVRLITRFLPDEAGPLLQFDILDTGVGMTEEQAEGLFQAFAQADSTMTRKFGGTGLGLTISKQFARMLGGDIVVVDTEPGCGTRFRTTIATGSLEGVKMIDQLTAAPPARSAEQSDRPQTPEPLNCRILVAEDGPDNQRLISFILKKAGAEVTVVENGQLAVDATLAARDDDVPFHVILMDMQMPVLDGYRATVALRDNDYVGPIIALTAHAMAEDREKCINSGCDDFTTKPIDRRKLIETIQKWRQKRPLPGPQRASLTATD